ncbi:hypothetical protein QZM66_16690 [Burkholderia contaminans]|uniref:hypothetical protein n=1 Tax=Burkholderia TaxID=32008 RepID=UPI001F6094D0|nr:MULTISPECIES: hypothetical protein [Burkholderia]MCI3974472.1 hypothetical protein [Burkholderia sp. HI4860]MDN7789194.1 hypothetical protein [Burkholderia contaminans]
MLSKAPADNVTIPRLAIEPPAFASRPEPRPGIRVNAPVPAWMIVPLALFSIDGASVKFAPLVWIVPFALSSVPLTLSTVS